MDLSALEGLERERVLEVLERDKALRSSEAERVRRMKLELQEIRRRGAKSFARQYSERTCARCQRPLGKLWNCGATCRGCSHRICSKCRVAISAREWKCTVCHAYRDVKIKSGEWFLEERAKKFPGGTDRNDTTGEKILKSYERLSNIAIVPPTPPPFSQASSINRSGGLQTSRPFTKSMENLFASLTTQMKKMSKSQNDVTTDPALLTTESCAIYRKEKRSQSDTALNWPLQGSPGLSLSQLLRTDKGADSSPALTDDDMSPGAELHQEKRGSTASLRVGEPGALETDGSGAGEIQLGLGYSRRRSRLQVSVCACRNLPYGDPKRRKCHPCVKLHLLPDAGKLKTSGKRNTTDPLFNETLEFAVERPLLAGLTLRASVWHSGTLKRRVFLGEALVPLARGSLEENSPQWYQLCPRAQATAVDPGRDAVEQGPALLIRVRFTCPSSPARPGSANQQGGGSLLGHLSVQVTGAANFDKSPRNSSVRGVLTLSGAAAETQDSTTQSQSSGSPWSLRLEFSAVPASCLQGANLELSLRDHTPPGLKPRLLGTAKLEQASSWQRVLRAPNAWHSFTLPLHTSGD